MIIISLAFMQSKLLLVFRAEATAPAGIHPPFSLTARRYII